MIVVREVVQITEMLDGSTREETISVPDIWVKWTPEEQANYIENFLEELDDNVVWGWDDDDDGS